MKTEEMLIEAAGNGAVHGYKMAIFMLRQSAKNADNTESGKTILNEVADVLEASIPSKEVCLGYLAKEGQDALLGIMAAIQTQSVPAKERV